MTTNPQSELIAYKLKHTIDLFRFDIDTLKTEQKHIKEISNRRLIELEENTRDHEQRLRRIQDDVTRNKVVYGLASTGSSFMSVRPFLSSLAVRGRMATSNPLMAR
jgi:hypothetical protein